MSPADIYPYSIDEVFIDVTGYLPYYHMSAHELAMTMVREVLYNTGITATAGIGTNLYLAKLAMDIVAKHIPADKDGVRIAELDEQSYRYLLWNHRPLTDFWMTGPGTVKRLEAHGIYTMGDLARFSIHGEDRLYEIFGVDAEILIDHAWGYEPCGMEQIKSYKPSTNSISEGQVLTGPYPNDKAKLIVREMAEILMFRLTEKKLVTESITLEIGYDRENVDKGGYRGLTQTDRYGRIIPNAAHGGLFYRHQETGKGEKTPASHAGHQEQVRQKRCAESQQLRRGCHHAPAQRADRRAQRRRFGWKTTKIARSDKRSPKSTGTS